MRTLSAPATQAVNAQETGEVFLLLLTIDHDALATPIRVVNNNEAIVSRGETFIAFPFELALPDEDGEALPRMRLRIDNVKREIVDALRAIQSPPEATLEVVLASSPDVVEAGPFVMTMIEADYDVLLVGGELGFEDVLNEPYPGDSFTPSLYPGLF